MIAAEQVLEILQGYVPRNQWIPSEDIYTIVELYGELDDQDREPKVPGSRTPMWKTTVRAVLVSELKKGRVRSRKRST
jgi:hypothetical protein